MNMAQDNSYIYATRSDVSEIRGEVKENFNTLNCSITKLVEQISKNAILQERMTMAWENTNQKLVDTAHKIESLTSAVTNLEIERIQYKAKWDFLFKFKSAWVLAYKLPLMIILFSLLSTGTADFFHWIKLGIKHWAGI
jgi:hypothetical protein